MLFLFFVLSVNEFTNEEIEQLKLANDWNKPLNLEKCVKKELTTKKLDVPHEKKIEKIIEKDFDITDDNISLSLFLYLKILINNEIPDTINNISIVTEESLVNISILFASILSNNDI